MVHCQYNVVLDIPEVMVKNNTLSKIHALNLKDYTRPIWSISWLGTIPEGGHFF